MKIAVCGATGLTGRSVVEQALGEGHDVVALVRNPAGLDLNHRNLKVLEGNPTVAPDVERCLIDGVEVVINCIGVGGKGDGQHTTVVSDSVITTIAAMRNHGTRRIVCMSNIGTGDSGPRWFTKAVVPLAARWLQPIIADKERMEAALRGTTDIEWISARMAAIVEGPAKPIRTNETGRGIGMRITAPSAARFLLDRIDGHESLSQTPSVSN